MLRKFGINAVLSLMVLALAAVPALAQSGHFVTGGGNAPRATGPNADSPNLVLTGKVAGLGGTTFEIEGTATATANYACRNNGGNFPSDPKKQTVSGPVTGSTGELPTPNNGQFRFSIFLEPPASTLDCPGGQTEVLTSVSYTNVVITLEEDGVVSDTLAIPGTFSFTYFIV
jgi:hypothetical protein